MLSLVSKVRSALRRIGTKPLESLPDSPDLFRVYRSLLSHPDVRRRPGGWDYGGKFYPDYLHMGGACHAIFREALKFCKGKGIDVGAGLWPLPGAVPVDVWRGPGTQNEISRIPSRSIDYVFSSHCLEHNADWQEVLQQWLSKLRPNGTIFLYLPHPDCAIWQVGSPFVGKEHKWTPTPPIIKSFLTEHRVEIVGFDDGPDAMFSFWVCGRTSF